MDISVSRLNHRLALQLPSELPLGLVFVLGRVQNLTQMQADPAAGLSEVAFDLIEKGHSIRCRLSQRAASETSLEEGVRIRAGGHLSFDPKEANYFLLARDIVTVAEEPDITAVDTQSRLEKTGLARALTDVKKRSEAVKSIPSDMPVWVQRMAPPGVAVESKTDSPDGEETPVSPAPPSIRTPPHIDQKLIEFIDTALESDEEVVLTPELLDQFMSAHTPDQSATTTTAPRPKTAKPAPQTDWFLSILLLTLIMLLIVAAATFLLLWLR